MLPHKFEVLAGQNISRTNHPFEIAVPDVTAGHRIL